MHQCSSFLADLTAKLNGYAHPEAHHAGREINPDMALEMVLDASGDEEIEPATGVLQDVWHIFQRVAENGNRWLSFDTFEHVRDLNRLPRAP